MAQDIRSVMTAEPISVEGNAALVDAASAMRDHGVGDVLVTENGAMAGIVTDRDITVRATARGADPINTQVAEVCSRELAVVESDQAVDEAIALMRERGVRRLPVVEGGRPIGIVSLGDLAVRRDRGSVLGEISASPPNE